MPVTPPPVIQNLKKPLKTVKPFVPLDIENLKHVPVQTIEMKVFSKKTRKMVSFCQVTLRKVSMARCYLSLSSQLCSF